MDGLAFVEELWAIHPAFGVGAGFIPIIDEPADVVGAENSFEIFLARRDGKDCVRVFDIFANPDCRLAAEVDVEAE